MPEGMETRSTPVGNSFSTSSSLTVGRIITFSPGCKENSQKNSRNYVVVVITVQLAGVAIWGILSVSCSESITLNISLKNNFLLRNRLECF